MSLGETYPIGLQKHILSHRAKIPHIFSQFQEARDLLPHHLQKQQIWNVLSHVGGFLLAREELVAVLQVVGAAERQLLAAVADRSLARTRCLGHQQQVLEEAHELDGMSWAGGAGRTQWSLAYYCEGDTSECHLRVSNLDESRALPVVVDEVGGWNGLTMQELATEYFQTEGSSDWQLIALWKGQRGFLRQRQRHWKGIDYPVRSGN